MRKYKAYIASNKYTTAFDCAFGSHPTSAISAVKRKNSPDWRDLYIWCVCIDENGNERGLNESDY